MTKEEPTLTYRCPFCATPVEGPLSEKPLETVRCPNDECRKHFRLEAPSAFPERVASKPTEESPGPDTRDDMDDDDVAPGEDTLRVAHPAMFRSNPLVYLLCLLGIIGGLAGMGYTFIYDNEGLNFILWYVFALCVAAGFFYLIAWWIQVLFVTLTITTKRSLLRKGFFSKHTTEVQHDDVRNMQIEQNFFQRLMGTGSIAISSSGQDDLEIVVKDIPNANEIVETVRKYQ